MRAPVSGLTMKRGADAGLRSALGSSDAPGAAEILRSALASASGSRLISAPRRSAEYSRVAADRHLDQHRGERGEDHSDERRRSGRADCARGRRRAEEEAELRQHRDGAGDGRRDGHGQRVAVLDVGQLVRDHAGDLVAVEQAHQAGGDRDRGVLRVAAGGEGVRLVAADEIDLGHRQPGVRRERAPPSRAARAPARVTGAAPCMRSASLSEFQ